MTCVCRPVKSWIAHYGFGRGVYQGRQFNLVPRAKPVLQPIFDQDILALSGKGIFNEGGLDLAERLDDTPSGWFALSARLLSVSASGQSQRMTR
jgi:hypothetical protein